MLLDLLGSLLKNIRARGLPDAEAARVIRQAIHGPLAEAIVRLTPTPIDDAVLEALRLVVPPAK